MDEVLPAIRKTGGYIPMSADDDDQDILAKAVLIAQRTIEQKDKLIQQQQQKITIDAPKVDSYDRYMDASGLHNLTSACKLAGLKPRKTIEVLISKGLLYRKGKTILPYQKCIDDGRFVIKQGVSGDDFAYSQVFVTKHGLAFLWKNKNILENCY